VQLGFARMPPDARRDFDRHHLSQIIPATMVFDRLHDALAGFEELPPVNPTGSPEGN